MRAVVVEHLGEHGTMREVPELKPEAREILVRVTAAGMNPVDWKIRDVYGHSLPFTLGQDFSGVVVEIGADVQNFRIGERIFGMARQYGAYAERTLVSIDDPSAPLCKIPDGVGDADAAGLPTPGLTALACVERIPESVQTPILVIGVTGGVGQLIAQIAQSRGLKIIGVGRSKNTSLRQQLGLSGYVSNDGTDVKSFVEQTHQAYPDGFDCIIDLVHPEAQIEAVTQLLRANGAIFSTIRALNEAAVAKRGFLAANVNLDGAPTSNHSGLKLLAQMVQAATLKVPISAEHDLADAVEALDQIKNGKISGKVILTMNH